MMKVYVVQIEENTDYVAVCGTVESVVKEIMNVYNEYGVLGITEEEIVNQIAEMREICISYLINKKNKKKC